MLLFKTKQSHLNSFAKLWFFKYICGRFVAGFSLKVWGRGLEVFSAVVQIPTLPFLLMRACYRLCKQRNVTVMANFQDIYFKRSFFALSFGLFATSKLGAALEFVLLCRAHLSVGVTQTSHLGASEVSRWKRGSFKGRPFLNTPPLNTPRHLSCVWVLIRSAYIFKSPGFSVEVNSRV